MLITQKQNLKKNILKIVKWALSFQGIGYTNGHEHMKGYLKLEK